MFGYVKASLGELTPEEKQRYHGVYCGICRQIRLRSPGLSRLALSFDMAFLSLLLMSLYEPEEQSGSSACALHPLRPQPWIENEYIAYAADMNVALGYYNALDDWQDDKRLSARLMAGVFSKHFPEIEARFPRQCRAIRDCVSRLSALERENCPNPDLPAGCFGELMGELFVYREDLWSPTLRQMGQALGRFIYLADAAADYRRDGKRGKYNPFAAAGTDDPKVWEELLVLSMGRCTTYYEMLPLVQDKAILDNILYSGVWTEPGKRRKAQAAQGGTT